MTARASRPQRSRGRPLLHLAAVGAGLLGASGLLSAPATAVPAGCRTGLGDPAVVTAIRSLPPYAAGAAGEWAWSTDPATIEGNFDSCATLSTALVTVQGATGSSPIAALMFHDGTYLGTATSTAYGFTSLDRARTTDDTVVLDYKDGRNVCTACAGPLTSVRYRWVGDHVQMLDPPPPQ